MFWSSQVPDKKLYTSLKPKNLRFYQRVLVSQAPPTLRDCAAGVGSAAATQRTHAARGVVKWAEGEQGCAV